MGRLRTQGGHTGAVGIACRHRRCVGVGRLRRWVCARLLPVCAALFALALSFSLALALSLGLALALAFSLTLRFLLSLFFAFRFVALLGLVFVFRWWTMASLLVHRSIRLHVCFTIDPCLSSPDI